MNNNSARFVIGMEAMTPTGMNLDIATTVAKADLGRFDQQVAGDGIERFTYASIEYISSTSLFDKCSVLIESLIDSLLKQLPTSLKPIPLLVNVPGSISAVEMSQWLSECKHCDSISRYEVVQQSGPSYLTTSLAKLNQFDAIMSISVDSLVDALSDLIEAGDVMSSTNPWGIIPSEGGAGLLLCRNNLVQTLKLKPKAKLGYFEVEPANTTRRSVMKLVRNASRNIKSFGPVFSDMTNLRSHTEDYGFALGARAECFDNPQQPTLINDLWGTLGSCSALALMACTIQEVTHNSPVTLLMFDVKGERALLQLTCMKQT
ncbi:MULTISPECIES: hypothetical protein [unclassified Vibrio]|uniref:hypothetical protein n=1 Tax=unclassified Vibrio TaxID=2614977 RepID=UPI000C81D209|nr:hypothetical protein [Vibrio sp. 10N.261.54.E10]PMK05582.1 hypothetical protein BCU07_21840 [Vibrio sp. 10N.261.54.E10]